MKQNWFNYRKNTIHSAAEADNRKGKEMKSTIVLALVLCLSFAASGLAKTYMVEDLQIYSRAEIEALEDKDIDLQIAWWEWQKAVADVQIADLEAQVQPLRDLLASLNARIADLNSQIASLHSQIEELRNAAVLHTIIEGECLWTIAAYHYHYGDGTQWPLIYDRNTDTISDPNLIFAGHTLWVPVPMVTSYTVIEGDYLGKIAGYDVVYDDRGMWPSLYEANSGIINDPNLIFPGQVLTIPRTAGTSRR